MMTLTSKDSPFGVILLLTLLFGVLWGVDYLQAAPPAKTAAAGKTEFSALRAQHHVKRIALKPHPAGSVANAAVRDYLIKTLQDLGAEVELQYKLQTNDYVSRAGQARFGNVENVVARFPGRESATAILLMAHYDSMPNASGAGDNASGVAATLETLRALTSADLPMKNTLIVLFNDAEESGLLGSQAFFGYHRWAEQVKLVLNFDSRGSRGPVFMYQTSVNDGSLVDMMAQVVPSPMASSLVHSLFNNLPFYTDLSISFKSGKAGMNFAFIDGLNDYHSSTDTANQLSLDSLQHLGEFELPLVRHFGEIELPMSKSDDRHYFNFLGDILINYSGWLDWALWLVSASLLIISIIRAIKINTFTLLQLLQGIGCAVLFIALPAFLVLLMDRIIDKIVNLPEILARQRMWFMVWSLLASGITVWLRGLVKMNFTWLKGLFITLIYMVLVLFGGINYSLLIVAVVLGSLATLLLGRPINKAASFTGGLLLLILLALVALLQLAGGAYVLTCSLLPVAVLQAWYCYKPKRVTSPFTLLLVAGLPATIILGGTALTFDQLVGYDLPLISVLPLLLLSLFFSPILDVKYARNTGLTLIAFGFVGLSWFSLNPPWSVERPQAVSQFVLHDANNNGTYWASEDHNLTDWHRITLGSKPKSAFSSLYQPDTHKALWLTPIENIRILSPKLELMSVNELQREVYVRITPAHGGDTITIFLDPSTELLDWKIDGQPLPLDQESFQGWQSLTGFAVPEGGVKIMLKLGQEADWPEIMLTSVHNDLPPRLILPKRNAKQMRGSASLNSDSTVTFERIMLSHLIMALHD